MVGWSSAAALGSRAFLHRSGCCVTLHAVGSCEGARTIMPHTRGVARVRRDPPETRQLNATKEEDGRASRIAAGGDAACGNHVNLSRSLCRRPDLDAVRHDASIGVAPERDQKLSRHGYDGDPPRAPL